MTISEYILDFFAKKSIDTAFVITGGQAMYLNDALAKRDDFEVVFMHHEQCTTMSADAYSRIKNKPSIAMVTAGPGAVNALTGVAGAYTDSAPIIVISGQAAYSFVEYQEKTSIRQYGIQGINIKHIVEPITKYFVTLQGEDNLDYILEEAYNQATTGRPGPVWIEVPLDVQRFELSDDRCSRNIAHSRSFATSNTPQNHALNVCEHIIQKLASSTRPLIMAGQGVSLANARQELRDFIEAFNIPLITSRLGIDLIESDHPLYVGRPGTYGERSANLASQTADFILVLGSRMASATVGHTPCEFGKQAYTIMIDIDEKELNKPNIDIQLKVNANLKPMLTHLLTLSAGAELSTHEEWIERCQQWRKNYPVCLPAYRDESPVNSYYFMDRLTDLADSQASIMVDTGSCFHVAAQAWKVKRGQTFLTTGGLSSMGYWAACIGSCLANDKKQTICITGDGSFQMNIQELATIAHNNYPIKIFILNNNGYLLIRHTQKNFMDNRLFGEGPVSGLTCPDALKVADSYGIKGIRIENVDELDEKIQEVLDYDGPVICDILTPEWQLLVPRVSSDKLADGSLKARPFEDMFPHLDSSELDKQMKF